MEAITVRDLLTAVGGTLIGPETSLDRTVSGVDTDSRDIHPGSLFLPLVGERFDGHAYIGAALEAGAARMPHRREPERYQEGRFYIGMRTPSAPCGIWPSGIRSSSGSPSWG